jgi:hypothetical protein
VNFPFVELKKDCNVLLSAITIQKVESAYGISMATCFLNKQPEAVYVHFSYSSAWTIISNLSKSLTNKASGVEASSYSCHNWAISRATV